MIFAKGAHHSAKFLTFDCSVEKSLNLYSDRLLFLKVYQVSAIKSMAEICFMIPKGGAKFEEKFIFCFINDKNLVNFVLSTKKPKKVHFDWCAKHTTFDLKKVQWSYIS